MLDVSDDAVRGQWIDATLLPYLAAYCTGSDDTLSAGLISFEEADFNPDETPGGFGGTWSDMGSTYDVTAANLSDLAQVAVHFPVGKYRFIRPFIETAVSGGTVTVVLVGTASS